MANSKTVDQIIDSLPKGEQAVMRQALAKNISNNLDMAGLVLWNDKPSRIEVQIGLTEDKVKSLKFKNGVASVIAEMRISDNTPTNAHSAYYAKDAYVNGYDEYVARKDVAGFKPMNPLKAMQDVTEQEEQLAKAS